METIDIKRTTKIKLIEKYGDHDNFKEHIKLFYPKPQYLIKL